MKDRFEGDMEKSFLKLTSKLIQNESGTLSSEEIFASVSYN